LSDEQWERVAPLLPGKPGDPGRSGADNRLFFEAILWVARTGSPWRDLHEAFGHWNSVFKRFRRWAMKGVFERWTCPLGVEGWDQNVMQLRA
jgi:transposase